MTLSDKQIQDLLRVGNPTDEECRLIRMGWDAAMRTKSAPDGWKLVPIEPTPGMIDAAEYVDWGDADVRGSCINAWNRMLSVAPEAKP